MKAIMIVGCYVLMRGQEIYNLQIGDVTPAYRVSKMNQNELIGYNVVIQKSKTNKNSTGYVFHSKSRL